MGTRCASGTVTEKVQTRHSQQPLSVRGRMTAVSANADSDVCMAGKRREVCLGLLGTDSVWMQFLEKAWAKGVRLATSVTRQMRARASRRIQKTTVISSMGKE